MIFKAHKMENKDQKNLFIMAVAGIGLYLFFKKKSATAPVVPPTTGGGSELLPIAPTPVYDSPVQPIYVPVEPVYQTPVQPIYTPAQPVAPSPISLLPVLTNPISSIINIMPVQQYPSAPIYEAPVYYAPEPIYQEPSPLKGSIEVGPLDKGEYGGGGGDFVSTPTQPVYQPPIDIYIPPIAPTPELKGTIEIGPIDVGQYGPAEDVIIESDISTPKMTLSMFDSLLYGAQVNINQGSGGGGIANGGDFGGGGGGFGSGQNFISDFIWYNSTPTLKGSIEVGNLDQGEFL
jgi:hypothetical protein